MAEEKTSKQNSGESPGDKAPKEPTASSKRAAEVEKNLGGTQNLRDFLSGAGWD